MLKYEPVTVERADLVREVSRLMEGGARLIMTVGTDVRPLGRGFEVTHLFGFDREGRVAGVVVPVPADDPR
ncbi:MAG: hypothetical protein CW346_20175, partial [Bacillaceae bacterium]|nr:hypothetical protein [Bacillaceae bacterium]